MKDNNYSAPQVNKNGKKKFLASVVALIIAITGGIGAKNAVKSYKGKNPEPTSQSDTVKTDPQEDLEYVLVKPFDINDDESVKETINAVNENNKKDDSVNRELTENMLKFYAGTLTKDDFPDMKDDDIANEIKNYSINLFEVTSASIPDYVNLKNGEKLTNNEESTKAIVLNSTLNENDYAYETYVTSYDTILNEQKKDIANGNKEDYSENTENFVYTVKTALDDDKLTNAEKSDIATTSKSQLTLFYDTMTKEDQTYFETDYQSVYNTLACDEWFAKNDIKTDIDYDKTNGGDKSKNEYVASDKKDAEKRVGVVSDNKKEKVKTGGQKTGSNKGKSSVVSNPTTKVSISSSEAVTKKKDSTKSSTTKKGGKVVSTSVHIETTSKISEEDVPPEEETTANKSKNTKSTSSQTTSKITYKDSDDDIPTYTDKEFNGLSATGVASAALGSLLAYQKRKRRD